MRHLLFLPAALALLSYTSAQAPDTRSPQGPTDGFNHNGMQKFVSRPDIEPARWNVQNHDKSRLAPGYWFVSPYEKNGYKLPGGSWIGPHIYDSDGGLIWSGSHMFNRINVMDFKVMKVGDKEMLSMLYAVEGNAYLLDHHYRVKETVFTGKTGVTFNMHDFHTVEDGAKYLYLKRNITHASRQMTLEQLGFDGECSLTFPGIEERDVQSKDKTFLWDATGNIPLTDSTMNFDPAEKRCRGSWDYLHSNAIDKFHDGHYLLSTRHSDTIYKISKDDGSIIWRLHGWGGERGDFEMINLNFSRQHHARLREHNDTHTIISLMDNALGADPQPASSKWSRAIQVALRTDTQPMTAELISSVDHPKQGHAFRRGSHQVLPNGNTFVGWSERALQSEHAPDGTLLMVAELESRVLGTYRAFKFPFVAEPDYPPDIHSAAFTTGDKTITQVHVSWNGATEVAKWVLCKTDGVGNKTIEVAAKSRSGFETLIEYNGFAKYVFVKALGANGRQLNFGKSETMETNANGKLSSAAVAAEMAWLQEGGIQTALLGRTWFERLFWNPIVTFVGGLVCGCLVFFALVFVARRGFFGRRGRARTGPMYSRVAAGDAAEFDEARLDDLAPRAYDRRPDGEVFKVEDAYEEDDDDDDGSRADLKTPSTERNSGG